MAKRLLALGFVIAAAIAAWTIARPSRDAAGARTATSDGAPIVDAHDEELARLRLRVELLERRLEELARELEDARERSPAAPSAAPAERAPSATVGPSPAADPLAGKSEADVARLRALALDATQPSRDRVLAAGKLMWIDIERGSHDARTPEVVDALIGLLETEPDAEVRREICFHALDATEVRHTAVLMRTLAQDVDERVRAQAADTLQHHLDDARVRAALQHAGANDPSELVRSTATEMLARWKP